MIALDLQTLVLPLGVAAVTELTEVVQLTPILIPILLF